MRKLRRTLGITTLLVALAGVASAAPAGILTADETGQRGFVDPIVNPGTRSSHEHCFYGVGSPDVPVETRETSNSLRSKPSTWDLRNNHTAVWFPCVYEDGRLMRQATKFGVLLYYKPVKGTEIAFPDDSGFVTGNSKATTAAQNPGLGTNTMGYRCNTGGGSFVANPEALVCSGTTFVFAVEFNSSRTPNWDPRFPRVQAYVRLDRGRTGAVGNITLGGPVEGVDGAMGPFSLHGDYMPAHDTAWYQRFLEQCIIPGRACGKNPAL